MKKKILRQVGFEPGTSQLLHTIVTERSRVRIPLKATLFFHVRRFVNFSYCGTKIEDQNCFAFPRNATFIIHANIEQETKDRKLH